MAAGGFFIVIARPSSEGRSNLEPSRWRTSFARLIAALPIETLQAVKFAVMAGIEFSPREGGMVRQVAVGAKYPTHRHSSRITVDEGIDPFPDNFALGRDLKEATR